MEDAHAMASRLEEVVREAEPSVTSVVVHTEP
ncbi:MAG: hypothetical protein ACE5EV_01135 [Gaiellales bacterium]